MKQTLSAADPCGGSPGDYVRVTLVLTGLLGLGCQRQGQKIHAKKEIRTKNCPRRIARSAGGLGEEDRRIP